VTSNENWRRYLDAGAVVGQVTLARAEEIAKGLLAPDKEEREHARRNLDDLGRTGRLIGGQLIDLTRRELAKQTKTIGSFDDLVDRLAEVVGPPRRASDPAPTTVMQQPAANSDPVNPEAELNGKTPKKHKKVKADRNEPSAAESRSKTDKIAERAKKNKKNNNKRDKKNQKRTEHAAGGQEPGRVLSLAKPLDPQGRP
jgi:hypothetical protein